MRLQKINGNSNVSDELEMLMSLHGIMTDSIEIPTTNLRLSTDHGAVVEREVSVFTIQTFYVILSFSVVGQDLLSVLTI